MKKIAIVNRGEPAIRFLRALYEYNEENNTEIQSVALYTTDDEHAPFVHGPLHLRRVCLVRHADDR